MILPIMHAAYLSFYPYTVVKARLSDVGGNIIISRSIPNSLINLILRSTSSFKLVSLGLSIRQRLFFLHVHLGRALGRERGAMKGREEMEIYRPEALFNSPPSSSGIVGFSPLLVPPTWTVEPGNWEVTPSFTPDSFAVHQLLLSFVDV
jgi:hypothetical protein